MIYNVYWKIINIIYIIIIHIYISYNNHLLLLLNNCKSANDQNQEYLDMCYKSRNLIYSKQRNINETDIVTIQDKLNYLMIHESPDYKSKIADKILLHNYSVKKLGIDICVPIIKIYNNSEEIKLEDLPDKFVLKCNHGSGMNILCNNKSNFDLEIAKKNLTQWQSINYGLKKNEFQYINIKRQIFSEIYLKDNLKDYKIYCFHGVPKFIRVQKKLNDIQGKVNNYYDLNWTLTDIETGMQGFFRRPDINFEKPKNFELMIKYSKKLSEDFAFARVDLYNINGNIYLGEMTFSPSNNMFKLKNFEQSKEMGKLIDLKKIKNYLFN